MKFVMKNYFLWNEIFMVIGIWRVSLKCFFSMKKVAYIPNSYRSIYQFTRQTYMHATYHVTMETSLRHN